MIFRSFGYFLEFPELNKYRKRLTASALRQHDVSESTGLVQVKPDQWVPLVSFTVLARVTDRWDRSTDTSALCHADLSRSTGAVQVKPDQWGPLVSDPVLFSVTDRWGRVNV